MKLGLLVDNVVTSIYKDRTEQGDANFEPFVAERIESLLQNTRLLGVELFQGQVRLAESSQHHEKQCVGTELPSFLPSSDFNGRWVCRTIEPSRLGTDHSSIRPDVNASTVFLALLHRFGFSLQVSAECPALLRTHHKHAQRTIAIAH